MTLLNSSEWFQLGTCIGDYDNDEVFTLEPSWLTRGAVIVGIPGIGKSHDITLLTKSLGENGSFQRADMTLQLLC